MNESSKKTISTISLFACLVIFVVLAGVCVKQYSLDKSVSSLTSGLVITGSANTTLAEALESYALENELLKQQLAAAMQSAKDWKAYAENTSAEVIYVPQYHEQTMVKEVEVAKPVYVNNEWREFESSARLMEWVDEHLAYLWIVGDEIADCDDYAARLQREAFKDGYLLSLQIISGGVLNGKNVSNYTELHMGNLAMIGNDIYFIEPQPEYFRIVFVCHRD
jgi:hypothetical protein